MWKDTVSGMAGSVSCTMLGLPFDVAKSRLQASGSTAYRGLGDCLWTTLRTEGPLALYKGTLPALSSAMSENAVGITVQRSLRRQLAAAWDCDPDTRYSFGTEVHACTHRAERHLRPSYCTCHGIRQPCHVRP